MPWAPTASMHWSTARMALLVATYLAITRRASAASSLKDFLAETYSPARLT
jgi:hypothetical protein